MLNETAVKRQKDLKRQENEVEVLTKEINAVCLENKDLKYQIQNLRKQKNSAVTQLNDINKANDELAKEIEKLTEDNKNQSQGIESNELQALNQTEKEGDIIHGTFYKERDKLEGKYHQVIEANIQRERDRKKEQAKKRQMMGRMAMAKMDRNKKSQSTKAIEEQIKMLQNEDISDRTPIISLLVDKWKHVNK